MGLDRWLKKGLIQKVEVDPETLSGLLLLAERDLIDSQLEGLSSDRKFATAYSAALSLATYVIRKQGYRVKSKTGHHQITFEIAGELLDESVESLIGYFDLCRRKRHKVDYDFVNVVSEAEVSDLIKKVKDFRRLLSK